MNVKKLLISGTVFCSLTSLGLLSLGGSGHNEIAANDTTKASTDSKIVTVHFQTVKYSLENLRTEAPWPFPPSVVKTAFFIKIPLGL